MKPFIAVIAFALILMLAACSTNTNQTNEKQPSTLPNSSANTGANQPKDNPKPSYSVPSSENDPLVATTPEAAAAAIISLLKGEDLQSLAAYIHPNKGLLFSPYAHIDTASAKIFPAASLPALTDTTIYHFGEYDGSGEPIDLTFKQYYDQFVYDKDFLDAETVGSDEILGTGSMKVNIKELFPESYMMDYHFSGFNEQYEGMDWASLILVLEEWDGAWYVSAIVHSQWTT
ncbi:hypothetical protein [Paenibacillus sinopodophylli]|uniref:hypothetical protein n=1 Tax=Paenibacillus sinopodophylli TaxID=1837342 RepID=UPI00110CCE07|nr:hypothetical protein [Paenibacillus sinopodophylli]